MAASNRGRFNRPSEISELAISSSAKTAQSAPPVNRLTAKQLIEAGKVGSQVFDPLYAQLGNSSWATDFGVNEAGQSMASSTPTDDAYRSLDGYTFDWQDTGAGNTGTLTAYDPSGKQFGSYRQQDSSGWDAFKDYAIMLASAVSGVGAMGIGPAAGLLGGASGGASASGNIGLGAGLGETAATIGTIGGEATAFGGLGELGALAAGAPAQTAFGSFGLGAGSAAAGAAGAAGAGMLEPASVAAADLGGGLSAFTPELGAIGADATAFGGLPELGGLAAGAPVETAFGSFGGGLLAPAATAATPATFNAAADSQLASQQLGITGAESAASATAPATVNLGSLGGTTGTAGGLDGLLAEVKQGVSGGLLGDASAWMKANPVLGRLLTSGATTLLSGAGGSSGGSAAAGTAAAPNPVQWNSGLQQGLLAPVQQQMPAAVQRSPKGLLAQGFANDGAWRYMGG